METRRQIWTLDASDPKGRIMTRRWPSRRKKGKVVYQDPKGRPRTLKGKIELLPDFIRVQRGRKVTYIRRDQVMQVEKRLKKRRR